MEGEEWLATNPFAALFPSLEVARAYQASVAREEGEEEVEVVVLQSEEVVAKVAGSPLCDDNVGRTQQLNNIIEEVGLARLGYCLGAARGC